MKKIILILLYIVNSSSFAFTRGNDLYPNCLHLEEQSKHIHTQEEALEFTKKAAVCVTATSTAFDDVTTVGYTWSMDGKAALCINEYYGFSEFSALQILDMTVKYLNDHPEYRNFRVGEVVAAMLHDNYPVPKQCFKVSEKNTLAGSYS
jgi:hypothetical protein